MNRKKRVWRKRRDGVKQRYNVLPKKIGRYNIKYVDKELKDYAGMNYFAGKTMGFNPLPERDTILIHRKMDKKTKMQTIVHEAKEADLMRKGKKYWDAHLIALKSERKVK